MWMSVVQLLGVMVMMVSAIMVTMFIFRKMMVG